MATKKATTAGDRPLAEELRELRAVVWRSLLDAEPGQVAGLSKELRGLLVQLEGLAPAEGKSRLDELAAKRAARRGDAADSPQSSRRGQPRRRGRGDRTG